MAHVHIITFVQKKISLQYSHCIEETVPQKKHCPTDTSATGVRPDSTSSFLGDILTPTS